MYISAGGLILLAIVLYFFFPRTGYRSESYGYGPVGGIGGFIILLLVLHLFGVI